MEYSRIQPLQDADRREGRSDLPGFLKLWRKRRAEAEQGPEWVEFKRRLVREIAIETGLIERLYVWDRGLTETLIEQGVDAALIRGGTQLTAAGADRVKALIDDQEQVIEGLFLFVKGDRSLSESYIKELHATLTRSQATYTAWTPEGSAVERELEHGKYKRYPNSPLRPDGTTHEYCPPEFVSDEMEQLIGWYGKISPRVPPDVAAAWLHHRFTQIHPFQDGNGRLARALASVVLLKAGGFPLVIRSSERSTYFDALELADAGDLKPLSELFGARQIESIEKALHVEDHVPRSFDDVLRQAERSLTKRPTATGVSPQALSRSLRLQDHAMEALSKRERQIKELLTRSAPDLAAAVRLHPAGHFMGVASLYAQGVKDDRGFLADWRKHAALIQLELPIRVDSASVIVALAFHGLQNFPTLMGVMGFAGDSNPGHSGGPLRPQGPVAEREFVFTDDEDLDQMIERFDAWLEPFIVLVFDHWWRSLEAGR